MKFPEADLCRGTFTIRDLDLPPEVKSTKKSLLRWFCLSFGLMSEQESRTTMLDVLDALFYFQFSKHLSPTTLQIQAYIKSKTKTKPIEKLIRYHLNKLSSLKLIERSKNKYRFLNSPYHEKNDMLQAFNHWVIGRVDNKLKDIGSVYQKLADSYK